MRFARLALLALACLSMVGACTGATAGWTYEPKPSVTPAPSTEASGAASAVPPASAEPVASGSAGASAPPPASASAAAGGTVVSIVASGINFTTNAVTAPAGAAFTLEFDNEDAATPHDVQIKDASGAQVFETDIFPGVQKRSYPVPALAAGSYPFVCTVHSNMTGTLTVQ
jgi:plastocyanin